MDTFSILFFLLFVISHFRPVKAYNNHIFSNL